MKIDNKRKFYLEQVVAVQISTTTVTSCSPEEVTSLKEESTSLDSAAEQLSAALTAVMDDLASKDNV